MKPPEKRPSLVNRPAPLDTSPDELLWLRLQQGEPRALDELVRRHARPLLKYGCRFWSDEEEVKDCLQDLFAELWLRRERLEPVRSVRAYLLTALHNRLLNVHRADLRRTPWSEETETLPFLSYFSVEDQWIEDETEREQLRRLNEYINALPPRQREAIYLKYYQNLTNEEIAEVLQINYQSVSNLLHRALCLLRSELADGLLPLLTLLGWFS